uniref:Uncharacterized protein n=1 Tax=Meloidogyne incognita TaxID=6306 RepID=A0A914M163_MELIC
MWEYHYPMSFYSLVHIIRRTSVLASVCGRARGTYAQRVLRIARPCLRPRPMHAHCECQPCQVPPCHLEELAGMARYDKTHLSLDRREQDRRLGRSCQRQLHHSMGANDSRSHGHVLGGRPEPEWSRCCRRRP